MEDDKAIRQMYELKFEAEKIPVTIAIDGMDGYKIARRIKPQIILLDLRMPKMTGDVMLEKLQKEDWIKNTHVVIMTNVNEAEAPKRLKDIGFDEFLIKAHITPRKLLNIVKKIIKNLELKEDKL